MFLFDLFRSPGVSVSSQKVDKQALSILRQLTSKNFTAYLVGGCVRDILLEREPKDFDVVTDARPNQIKRLFRRSIIVGRRFKLAIVLMGDRQYETATFRRDPDDTASLQDQAKSGASLYQARDNTYGTPKEDAYRRDFTVNALFWDPKSEKVIDYTGGLPDLKKRILRSIGDPNLRFQEDPVRMLRAIRLSTRLGFTIHGDSLRAIEKHGDCIQNASRPRVFDEILRLFTFSKSREAISSLWNTGLMAHLLPAVHDYVQKTGGKNSPLWRYLDAFDRLAPEFDTLNRESPRYVQENAIRLATLLAPLFHALVAEKRLSAYSQVDSIAKALIQDIVVEPFKNANWRVPKLLCIDLANILVSLEFYRLALSQPGRCRRMVGLPWFYTAFSLWKIAAMAEQDAEAEKAIAEWEKVFESYLASPHPARRGNYIPVNPDTDGKHGFPGDTTENRDALFPPHRQPNRPPRKRRRQKKTGEEQFSATPPCDDGSAPPPPPPETAQNA
ncbi:MAG: polynucleotide adenylyltransferase PcnB [Kiritimatiellia bacterium]